MREFIVRVCWLRLSCLARKSDSGRDNKRIESTGKSVSKVGSDNIKW